MCCRMPLQELVPYRFRTIRCGLNSVFLEDRSSGCSRDRHDSKFAQFTEDPGVSPAGSPGQFDNKLSEIPASRGPPRFRFGAPFLVPIRTEPSLECAILNNGDKLAQCRANSFSEPDESPPLAMVKRDPLGEFPSQDLVLNGEVLELGNQLIVVRSTEREQLR